MISKLNGSGQGLSTKKTTFSTSSSTYVTALNVTGPGTLRQLNWAGITGTINVRVTLDGVVYATYQSTSNAVNYTANIDGSTAGSLSFNTLNLAFKSNCLIEVNVSTSTATITMAYDN
jgi:hypothetical protein